MSYKKICSYKIIYSRGRQPFVVGGPKPFLPIHPNIFDHLFFAPQNLKRSIIFLKRATFGPRAIVRRPLICRYREVTRRKNYRKVYCRYCCQNPIMHRTIVQLTFSVHCNIKMDGSSWCSWCHTTGVPRICAL